ncbi:DNA glycosylase [Phaeosphaeria sp. MPI-PUGE-AT-0046c]|nr:DNA glycosylase [Phaeosphaeria sp. MPI-PUGE-AT-0046c]
MPPTLRKRSKKPSTDTSSLKLSPKTAHKTSPKTSPHFPRLPYTRKPNASHLDQPPGLPFQLQPAQFGLIQERICSSLYALIVQAILWNQTRGIQARPVLFALLAKYPTPEHLSSARLDELTALLQPLGLHNVRAKRLIDMASKWLEAPPTKYRRYRKLNYPEKRCGKDVGVNEVLEEGDERQGWEVAHLPGVGRYALDSFRIFGRDELRGLKAGNAHGKEVEQEWKTVRAEDKDLRAYLEWRWEREGMKGKSE